MRNLFFTLALLISPLSLAGDSSQSIEDFMQDYLDGYEKYLTASEDSDIAWVTEHFSEPLVMMPPTGPAPMATHEAFATNIKYFMEEALKKKGVVKLEWTKLQVAKLSGSQALVSGLANALDKNNRTVEQRASIYLLTKTEDGWSVSVNLPHSPNTVPTVK